jgi:hypothetical protein
VNRGRALSSRGGGQEDRWKPGEKAGGARGRGIGWTTTSHPPRPGPLEIVEKEPEAVAHALETELENESGFQ